MKAHAHPRPSTLALIVSCFCAGTTAFAAELNISQLPPTLGQTLAPNILYIHDDSGSMTWAYMPDGRSITNSNKNRYTSSTWNGMYFNPEVDYLPPLDHEGVSLGNASFTSAWENGYLSNRNSYRRNLETNYRVTTIVSGSTVTLGAQFSTEKLAFYHQFNPSKTGCAVADAANTKENCYDMVKVSAAQRQNFANWYSYYRTREMAAKAGISRAFAQLGEGARLGYGRINKSSNAMRDGKSVPVIERGVREFKDDPDDSSKNYRKQFYDWLLGVSSSGGTPLRPALDAAGRYYKNPSEQGPWSTTPGVTGGNILACRKSFTILMTDGFWNGSAASSSDGAGTDNHDQGEGSPFEDNYDSTLADVAMYYWKNDLLPDIDNKVPPTPRDPATWQHMTTYTVGLGVEPVNVRKNGVLLTNNVKETAFAAITDPSISITWPQPASDSINNIADLLHAGVNGRGDFFSAGNPSEFANAMRETLASISDQVGIIAPLGQSASTAGQGDTMLFQAKFDTSDWQGWLTATAFDPDSGKLEALPVWTSKLPVSAAERTILSYKPRLERDSDSSCVVGDGELGGSGIEFKWSELNCNQRKQLNAGSEHFPSGYSGSMLLDWVRGVQSAEEPSGIFRKRSTAGRLGDIVNSKPLYVNSRNQGFANRVGLSSTEREAYRSRISSASYQQRERMVYVGANDGMLHAFHAGQYTGKADDLFGERAQFDNGSGEEVFAYVPAAVYEKLPNLALPEYLHRYYVDGSPVSGDAYIDRKWRTVLIGSTGAGGKSYFALDIDNPSEMSAAQVMWEFTHPELGLTIGQATIARLSSGKWVAIFGNGYNSTSHKAQLFIVDLADGKLIRVIDTGAGSFTSPNGLASPLVVDTDVDGNADLVYAGDYLGNLWKFDLTAADPANWKISFGGKPLFKATDSTGKVQPITVRPTVRRHPSQDGLALYFGTGKVLLVGDQGDMSEQALYGIFDLCGRDSSSTGCKTPSTAQQVLKSSLLKQRIYEEGTTDFGEGVDAVSADYRLVTQEELTDTHQGFYLILTPPDGSKKGERVVGNADISFSDRIIYTTLIPNDDPCEQGADGWIMEIDPFSGGRKDYSVFDMNNDTLFNAADNKGGEDGTPPSGRRSPGGSSVAVLHGLIRSFKVGTYGVTANLPDPNLLNRQSWQQNN